MCVVVTSDRERLETFGSHLINCVLVYVLVRGATADFTAALMRWAGGLPQLIKLMVIGGWLVTAV